MIKNKSFTLIELLVVIVIIGILAGVIIVSTSSSIGKANIAKVKVFENSIQNELGANMVSRWKLDEIVGTTTTPDAWGNNTGTLGDGVTASTYPTLKDESECVTGKCMYFDGVDDGVNCVLDFYSNQTISFWFNAEDLSRTESVLGKVITLDEVEGYNWMFYRNYTWMAGNLGFLIYYTKTDNTRGNILSQINFKIKNWYFITLINQSNGNYKVYIDGELKAESNPADFSSWRHNVSSLYIANYWGKYKGYIDDIRVYNAVLSSSQIKQEYVAGLNSLLANNNISKEEYNQRIESFTFNY